MSNYTVWKYNVPLGESDIIELEMPQNAEVLTLGEQYKKPQIWVKVDPNATNEKRYFRWAGTGHPLNDVGKYVGSIMLNGGAFVFHLFECER